MNQKFSVCFFPLILLLFLVIFFCRTSIADTASDIYAFETPQEQAQFTALTQQLRCLVCQNETLADSNAPLAKDLRAEIARMIRQKQTDEVIREYLVKRYGNFVLYKPVLAKETYVLWFAPLLLLLTGLITLGILVIKQRQKR